nr:DNA-directed RNA polymerase [Candidatus Freyarchaeota archaeon]
MSFCPNDGTLMMPKKENGKSQLICRKCGYKTEPTDAKAYRLVVKIPHTPKDKTTVVEGEDSKKLEIDEDEREELKRQALEFYAEEGET